MVTVREHVAVAVADMLWLPRVNTEESVKLKKKYFSLILRPAVTRMQVKVKSQVFHLFINIHFVLLTALL